MGNSGGKDVEDVEDVDERVVQYLKESPIFSREGKKALRVASTYFQIKSFKRGEYIIKKGEKGTSLFMIAEGSVLFTLPADDGNELPTRMLSSGEIFGEFALVYDTERTANAVAETDCTVLELSREKYLEAKGSKYMQPLEDRVKIICSMLLSDGLKRIAFLQDVPEETLDMVGHLFRFEEVPERTTVFKEGDTPDKFYIVFQGELVVTKKDDLGFHNELGRISDGMNFGDKALISQSERSATVTTMTPCQFFTLTKEDFTKFRKAVPQLNDEMIEKMNSFNLAQGITKTVPIFSSLSQKGEQLLGLLSRYQQYKPKSSILTQGESEPRNLFIILKGSADVFIDKKRVNTLSEGDYFGEVSLVAQQHAHSATVKTKSGCWCLIVSQNAFENIFLDEPQLYAEIKLRVLGSKSPLETVLLHPKAAESLGNFLEKEWAVENVEFWEAVNHLENLGNRKIKKIVLKCLNEDIDAVIDKKRRMLEDRANKIFESFIKPHSDKEINISSDCRKALVQRIDEANYSYDMFQDAKQEIYAMVEADNYSRYLASDEFKELISEIGQYKAV
mmetsp:Transcript_16020/g.19442  ORF Transcript_16020/g.19442 Transcript_16020/m.19442 type:complete len:562 (+) Transcript_16020:206-1891(+)